MNVENARGKRMYRILTENKNPEEVKKALVRLGLNYTVYYGEGAWQGIPENSLMIELDNIPRSLATQAAILIKELNRQEAVLLQEIPVVSHLL